MLSPSASQPLCAPPPPEPALSPCAAPPTLIHTVNNASRTWLAGRRSVVLPGGRKALIVGYLPETFLASTGKWRRLSQETRETLYQSAFAKHETALLQALDGACRSLVGYLKFCTEEGLDAKLGKICALLEKGCDLKGVSAALSDHLYRARVMQRQAQLATQIAQRVDLADYPAMFPAAQHQRRIIAVLGPTNSGKTHDAFERLAKASSGVYLGPLRLLALEAFSRLNDEFATPTSLVTGEEHRLVEGSRVTASTIEMLDVNQPVEVAVIDEIQMLDDADRGWAWTQAVVGADADELWLLGARSAEPAVRALAKRLGLPVQVRYKERKHPLSVPEHSLGQDPRRALEATRQGDALIVFSRRDALNLRDDLLAMGRQVACIYGALSPEVRENEARRFASGEASILVATDAIGMGLNLPIRRVVMMAVQKFDGVTRNELPMQLMQQIGGRAGRYGHAADDEEGVVLGLTPAEHKVVKKLMRQRQEPLSATGFRVAPGLDHLDQLSDIAQESRLAALLALFARHCDRGDKFFRPVVPEDQIARAQFLDTLDGLALPTKHLLSLVPLSVDERQGAYQRWCTWARAVAQGGRVLLSSFLPAQASTRVDLQTAEAYVKLISAYRWCAHRLPENFPDEEAASQSLHEWVAVVDRHLRSASKQGVGGGRPDLPSWYWETRKRHDRYGERGGW